MAVSADDIGAANRDPMTHAYRTESPVRPRVRYAVETPVLRHGMDGCTRKVAPRHRLAIINRNHSDERKRT
jgi:hypothetical protein